MTAEQFLVFKDLMPEGGKILLEPISDKTMKLVNLAQLLEEYHILKSADEDIMAEMVEFAKKERNETYNGSITVR